MIILEDPYVSPELATFAADRQEPVLDTPAARQAGLDYGLHLNLVSSRDFGRLCCQGQRLYSNSENALDWLYSRSGNAGLVRATELLKNKLLFRQRLAPLFPDFHFRELTLRDVMETHFDSLPGPCVLKPAVGFFSLGVYSIENAQQWRAARDDIAAGAVRWRKEYPAAVLDNQVWLLESLIQGTEYAVDVYFNSRGEAVICNILQHDFASSEDVSDRLYYTSADIIRRMSTNPADILHLPKGRMSLGVAADLTIFDPDQEWTIDPEQFASKGRNTPFAGTQVKGRVKYTIVDGQIVYQDT